LSIINLAYTGIFHGYKGGEYSYDDYTTIHFEESIRDYTDGEYCAEIIARPEKGEIYKSQEERLVKLAFS
jgi:hypothetical protein